MFKIKNEKRIFKIMLAAMMTSLVMMMFSCSAASDELTNAENQKVEEKVVNTNNDSQQKFALYVAKNEIAQRLESDESTLWTADSKVTDLYSVYIAGVDEVAYYECKVVTNGEDAGYVLVSVTQNDILIPETSEEGKTLTEQYAAALGDKNFNLLRYDYFKSAAETCSVSRSANSGSLLATKGFLSGDILVEEISRSSSGSDWYYECRNEFKDDVIKNGAIPQYTKEEMDIFYDELNSSVTRGKVELPYIKGGTHYQLRSKFSNGQYMPRWRQYDMKDGYPAGCGSTAWSMLYAYWHQFKGKNKLFNGKNLNQYCTKDGGQTVESATSAMSKIGKYCNATTLKIGSTKYRMTLPYTDPGMKTGIKYAKEKGYTGSVKCKTLWADWQGATDNIISEIKNDKPVILYFDPYSNDNRYFKFHYAVITGVTEHYWTNSGLTTQLRLDICNGWGNDGDNYKQIYAFTHDYKVKATNCFDYYTVNIN